MKRCRDCIHWYQTSGWKGNCRKHPWPRDKYADDADPSTSRCKDYVDKYAVTTAQEK